jgi:glycosyltransferase involved in cell wall biosynthesis
MVYNSKYTMNLAKKLLPKMNIKPKNEYILSPHYTITTNTIPQKEDYILTVGRLEWNKGLAALPTIAREVGRRIIVIGRADSKESKEVIKKLRNVRNIEVIPNADEKTKWEYYKHASIYLHLKQNEHFGIAVLDAIATATIPIVPKTGGPWTDITEEGKYGLGYVTTTEIPKLINNAEKLISRENVYKSKLRYSPEKFRAGVLELLKIVTNH